MMLEDLKFNLNDWQCKACGGLGRVRYEVKHVITDAATYQAYTMPCAHCKGTGWIEINYEDNDDETN